MLMLMRMLRDRRDMGLTVGLTVGQTVGLTVDEVDGFIVELRIGMLMVIGACSLMSPSLGLCCCVIQVPTGLGSSGAEDCPAHAIPRG